MGNARLFLALWPDEAIRRELVRRRDAWNWPSGASPVADAKLHVTLHFLGSVDEARIPELMEGFNVPYAPFELELDTAKVWHQSIAVLEPSSKPPQLLDLHAALELEVARMGLEVEDRLYKPHVTMARRAGGATPPEGMEPVRWTVDGYALVQSKMGDGGEYHVLHRY
jgi:RNA 2',3'-cyclic 3'-phosphodiesterase